MGSGDSEGFVTLDRVLRSVIRLVAESFRVQGSLGV